MLFEIQVEDYSNIVYVGGSAVFRIDLSVPPGWVNFVVYLTGSDKGNTITFLFILVKN